MKKSKVNIQPNLLIIFAKNPEKGKVKTRLAQTIGDQKALEVYQELLQVTKSISDPLQVHKQVWYSRFINPADLWSPSLDNRAGDTSFYEKRLQQGDSLGKRMQHAFEEAFRAGYQKVVIIGTDCSSLETAILQAAYQLLDEQQVVIGPARDGGYYLLGMSQFYPDLFEDKQWSTPSVCKETIQQLEQWNVSYEMLPVLNDIDTEEDLRASNLKVT